MGLGGNRVCPLVESVLHLSVNFNFQVSIIPRGDSAFGSTHMLNQEVKLWHTEQIMDRLGGMLGGRAAESIVFNTVSTGSNDDLKKVTDMAYRMVTSFGMSSKVGLLSHNLPSPSEGRKLVSQHLLHTIDDEVLPSLFYFAYCCRNCLL